LQDPVDVRFYGALGHEQLLSNLIVSQAIDLSLAAGTQTMVSGWTAGLMLVMFAYYVVYNMLLMRKQIRLSGARSRYNKKAGSIGPAALIFILLPYQVHNGPAESLQGSSDESS
jgi:hypothetical protein